MAAAVAAAGEPRARSLSRMAWPSVSRIAPRRARVLSSPSSTTSLFVVVIDVFVCFGEKVR